MAQKLTDRLVREEPAPAKGQKIEFDSEVRGFGLRVTSGGARAFILQYRINGRERRVTIGGWPEWRVADARAQAQRLKRDIDLGIDPLAKPEPEPTVEPAILFKGRAEQFLEHGRRKRGLPMRPKTATEYRRALLTYALPLHERPLAEIARGEIAALIRTIATQRGEVTAMRTRAALSRLWSWAIANGHADLNPVTGTEGYATPKRSRVLTDDELKAIWTTTAGPGDFNLIVRLLLWTGARRSEIGGMLWSDLQDGIWTIPGERTKNHRPLVLPLPRQAMAALAARPKAPGRDLIFGRGAKGFDGWSNGKERLDRAAGVTEWDLHDLRRTVQTRLAQLDVRPDVVSRILNHALDPVTAAYDHHGYESQKAAALQQWADTLDRVTGTEPTTVVPLRKRR